ncbi:MAG: hypothetical protein JWM96_419, partial [Alphaproteobacteria bacterium]|nr:hypothetical protein [Alphaproteobacteria bacterium]
TTRDVQGRYLMAVHGANMQPDEQTQKQIRRQALDALIDEQIRIQEATKLGVTPTAAEVDESFAKLAQQNGLPPEQFKAAMANTPGVYESIRRQMSTQIAWANVVKKKIRPQVNITENDITAYIQEKEKNPAKVEYQVAEIFLRNTDNNQKLAQQLIAQLNQGKRFSVLARQFSQGLEASKGGMLGWIPENRLEPVLDKAIKATPVGRISSVITSPRGLHILLILEKRDVLATKQGSQRINLKQILIPLPPQLPPEIMDKAMAQAKFLQSKSTDCKAMDEVLKKINSPMSRDLGQMRLADLPPAAVKIVKDLPLNKASEPARLPEGLAIFMVCSRTDTNDEAIREDVANAIGTERLNRLQYRYYRDLRAAAYVDIKQN